MNGSYDPYPDFSPLYEPTSFSWWLFSTAYGFIRDTGNETSQMNLSSGIISKIKVLLPPIREQLEIVGYLKQQTAKLDFLQTEAKNSVTLLQERRTALISAAVTGKIDVRGLVSAKPEVKTETVPC